MIKDRSIDLTENRIFQHNDSNESHNLSLFRSLYINKFAWNHNSPRNEKEMSIVQKDNNVYFFKDKLSDEMGFNFYGELDNPFFTGNVSEFSMMKHTLEGYLVLDCNVETICARCGKQNTVFDLPFTQEAVFSYYPPLCRNCYEYHLEDNENPFKKYKEEEKNWSFDSAINRALTGNELNINFF